MPPCGLADGPALRKNEPLSVNLPRGVRARANIGQKSRPFGWRGRLITMNHQYDPTKDLVSYAVKVMAWTFAIPMLVLVIVLLASCAVPPAPPNQDSYQEIHEKNLRNIRGF
jgi:hypothetical protein